MGRPPYSEAQDHLVRRFLTPAHHAALETLTVWMTEAGMSVRLDGAANLVGRYEGANPHAPALMIGSHIDTVRNGGRYDGALGVMLAVDVVEVLHQAGRRRPFAIEVIAFGDEEGSRFPTSMTCSRAVAGTIDPSVLTTRDAEGVTLAEAYAAFGLPTSGLMAAKRKAGDVAAFLEAHIEQGPVLEAADLALGVVSAIAAQKRMMVRIEGAAGHAGTTPMGLRRDPVPAAAEVILAVERICSTGREGLVGTVGRVVALPGSFNVIPGAIEVSLDVRAATTAARDAAVVQIAQEIHAIVARRGLAHSIELLQELSESPCDPALMDQLAKAVGAVGVKPLRLQSGAGHDAMTMAALCPTAMLFLRCKGGVSHNPAEDVGDDDCSLAAQAMLAFIDSLNLALPS